MGHNAGVTRPNVLLITVDQWRGECLSAAGHPMVKTPHLDALVADGVRFTNHYANCAPCGPSRASLLTGQYLMNHRSVLNGTPLDDRFTNLAREARALGYDPVLFGYTDTSIDPRTVRGDDRRLRTYEGVMPGFREGALTPTHCRPYAAWLRARGYDAEGDLDALHTADPTVDAGGRGSTWAPTRYAPEHSLSAFVTDHVIDEIAASTPGWFVHASYLRPHPPWRATRAHHDLYDPALVPPPVRLPTVDDEAARHPFLEAALSLDFVRAPAEESEQRQQQATYYALMNEVDDELGRLFAWLRRTGRWDDTLVVLTADHGEELGDHWLTGKLGFFDGSYHIPLIVRDPRPEADTRAAGRRSRPSPRTWT